MRPIHWLHAWVRPLLVAILATTAGLGAEWRAPARAVVPLPATMHATTADEPPTMSLHVHAAGPDWIELAWDSSYPYTDTQPPEDPDLAAALAAAVQAIGGMPYPDCLSLDDNPDRRPCVRVLEPGVAVPDTGTASRGLATFGAGGPDGEGGYLLVMGRARDGAWHYWYGTQQPSHRYDLPGPMTVCTGGDRLNVRAGPGSDTELVGELADLSTVTAEDFVLTEPGSFPYQTGHGWYRVSAPLAGWVSADYLSHPEVDARIGAPPCTYANGRDRR